MIKLSRSKLATVFMCSAVVLPTFAMNPWTSYDPINIPKMLVLVTSTFLLLGTFSRKSSEPSKLVLKFLAVSTMVLVSFTIPIFFASSPLSQQFWGVWGRSTGVLTLGSLVMLSALSSIFFEEKRLDSLLKVFARSSYILSMYVILQLGGLDPIPWSANNAPIATLGNINFMSSFLGMANCLFISKLAQDRMNASARLHFIFFFLLNLFLIWESKSIQGLGVIAAGTTLVIFQIFWRRFDAFKSILFLVISLISGALVILGTAGFGIFGKYLIQETVLFRIDYWKTGAEMFRQNMLTGVGIDSYGDYYRQYRDLAAVNRTGPQRVSDTAHNVFLDVFSGGGIVVGSLFILFVVSGLIAAFKLGISKRATTNQLHLSPILFGWLVFLLISINQIGVTVWGFCFLGLAIGGYGKVAISADLKQDSSSVTFPFQNLGKRQKTSIAAPGPDPLAMGKSSLTVLFSSLLAALMLALPPFFTDIQFLDAVRNSNSDKLVSLVGKQSATKFHVEKSIDTLRNLGLETDALSMARNFVTTRPQSYRAWVAILEIPKSQPSEKLRAAQELLKLDPQNLGLRTELKNILRN